MIQQTFSDIYDENLAKGAIINDRFPGFEEDYMVLHCLLRKYKPISVFEVGTHTGLGTKIIKNAVPEALVYSLDLPNDLYFKSMQHPISEQKRIDVGAECNLPFTQFWGDSTTFDFSQHPCEAYYVDAEHSEANVFIETTEILKNRPKIVIYHDTDSPDVMAGLQRGMTDDYDLYRVTDTRISYLLLK